MANRPAKAKSTKPKASKSAAPQQYLGYALNLPRMFIHLLQAQHPDDSVAIEVHDDVSVTRQDGTMLVEQIATSQDKNPIANEHPKIWKTLANWVKGAQDGVFVPKKTDFVFYILQERKPEKIVKALIESNDISSAKQAISEAKKHFWGKAPKFAKKNSVADDKKEHLETIFSADDNLVAEIVSRFQVKVGKGDIEFDISDALSNTAYKKQKGEDFKNRLLGWLNSRTQSLIAAKQRAIVKRQEFIELQRLFNERYDSAVIINYDIEPPGSGEVVTEVKAAPNYIKQLQIIELSDTDFITAATDFLKARTFRAKLTTDGECSEEDFKNYQNELVTLWHAEAHSQTDDKISDIAFGKRLYGACMNKTMTWFGKQIPNYFTRGHFHHLANMPFKDLLIGWHRKFKEKLKP